MGCSWHVFSVRHRSGACFTAAVRENSRSEDTEHPVPLRCLMLRSTTVLFRSSVLNGSGLTFQQCLKQLSNSNWKQKLRYAILASQNFNFVKSLPCSFSLHIFKRFCLPDTHMLLSWTVKPCYSRCTSSPIHNCLLMRLSIWEGIPKIPRHYGKRLTLSSPNCEYSVEFQYFQNPSTDFQKLNYF